VSPALVGFLVVATTRRRGRGATRAIIAGIIAVLALLGYAAWNALPPSKETPLIVYLLLAVVPATVAVAIARVLTRRSTSFIATWAAAVGGFYIASLSTLVGAYWFVPLLPLPDWLGCYLL
jgi:uncharacterized membrane protein YeaQ/YmgE (transglycosylase-associated protein family)